MSAGLLVDFIVARLDHDERIARIIERSSLGEDGITQTTRDLGFKRQVVALHPSCGGYGERCATCQSEDDLTGDPWPCATLRALASAYRTHPDFDERWLR